MAESLRVTHVVLSLDVGGLERNVVNQIRERAATKPRDPLEPDPLAPKPEPKRPRSRDGRFMGPRANVEGVPRLPSFPASWALEDPRQRGRNPGSRQRRTRSPGGLLSL